MVSSLSNYSIESELRYIDTADSTPASDIAPLTK